MAVQHFSSNGGAPLDGPFDLAAAVARTPVGGTTKGAFFLRHRAQIGGAWGEVAPTLERPPLAGRYFLFSDYPSRDHVRVIDAAARLRLPALSPREAHRQLGGTSFEEIAGSAIGRAAMRAAPRDPAALLGYFPEVYTRCVKGISPLRVERLEGGGARLLFDDFLAVPEYMLGLLEAVVVAAGAFPRVEGVVEGDSTRFEVRWTRSVGA
ncbi:MAG TPA: DUF2378 family protein [Polyangiaceae bacterium]